MNWEDTLARRFAEHHPRDAAALLEVRPSSQAISWLTEVPPPIAAAVLEFVDGVTAASYLVGIGPEAAATLVELLSLETAGSLLRRLESDDQAMLLSRLPKDKAEILGQLLRYPENSAGALMNPRSVSMPDDIDVEEALVRLRRHAADASYYVYVVDRGGFLVGVASMRDLMLADPNASLASVMHRDVARLRAETSLPSITAHPAWLEYQVLPVVDEAGRLIGALRHKNLRRLADQSQRRHSGDIGFVASALGELYQIGLTGLVNVAGGPGKSPGAVR